MPAPLWQGRGTSEPSLEAGAGHEGWGRGPGPSLLCFPSPAALGLPVQLESSPWEETGTGLLGPTGTAAPPCGWSSRAARRSCLLTQACYCTGGSRCEGKGPHKVVQLPRAVAGITAGPVECPGVPRQPPPHTLWQIDDGHVRWWSPAPPLGSDGLRDSPELYKAVGVRSWEFRGWIKGSLALLPPHLPLRPVSWDTRSWKPSAMSPKAQGAL